MRLQNKVVIVTGAASGMGESHARRVIDEGGYLVLTDINADAGQTLAEELGERVRFVQQDITVEDDWQRVVDTACDHFGGIDVLVNNAGILSTGDIHSETADNLRKVLDVNVVGTWLGIRAVSPVMARRGGGSIVNISSQVAYRAWSNYSVYGSSKWAIRGLTKHMAKELASQSIRVNAILPGAVDDTGMFSGRISPEYRQKIEASIPLGKLIPRDHVSSLMVFLASDESGSITGTDNLVDGGVSL